MSETNWGRSVCCGVQEITPSRTSGGVKQHSVVVSVCHPYTIPHTIIRHCFLCIYGGHFQMAKDGCNFPKCFHVNNSENLNVFAKIAAPSRKKYVDLVKK